MKLKSRTQDRCVWCKEYSVYECGYSPHRGASSCKQCNMTGRVCKNSKHPKSAWIIK